MGDGMRVQTEYREAAPVNYPVGVEGPEREWKVRLPKGGRIANTLCAFANGEGGTLLVGVRDTGEIAGITNPKEVRTELKRLAAELEPPQKISARTRTQDGLTILEVHVSACTEPVAVRRADEELVMYVREGSSSRQASREEARALARVTGGSARLDATGRRLLTEIAKAKAPTLASIAKASRMGARTARRGLVPLIQAGLVLENPDRRLWLTPHGHRRLRRE